MSNEAPTVQFSLLEAARNQKKTTLLSKLFHVPRGLLGVCPSIRRGILEKINNVCKDLARIPAVPLVIAPQSARANESKNSVQILKSRSEETELKEKKYTAEEKMVSYIKVCSFFSASGGTRVIHGSPPVSLGFRTLYRSKSAPNLKD